MESYIGLVEVGVGLVPGAGGLTYIARRAAENAATSTGKDLLPFLTEGFTAAAMAKVGTSALESRKLGYLLDSDVIVPHKDELLFVAINEAKAMYQGGYRAPHKRLFPVAGRSGIATIKGSLVNMRDGGFISAARLPHRQPDRRRGVWRRRRCGHAGERGIPDDAGAPGLLRAAGAPQDAGTHHGHVVHRQAGAQLIR
jgi:enoyl-CoA hydratase/carnithine racemase